MIRLTTLLTVLLLTGCVSISGPSTSVVETCEIRPYIVHSYDGQWQVMDHKVCYVRDL